MRNQSLTLGVVGTSNKENEFRLPIHPAHLPRLEPALQSRVFVEEGYGHRFGVNPAYLTEHVAGIMSREELFEHCDVILLPKPTEADFILFRGGQILWGWPHCVQDPSITQVGIDKKAKRQKPSSLGLSSLTSVVTMEWDLTFLDGWQGQAVVRTESCG